MEPVPLKLPRDMHYDCVKCGRGCREFTEIPVDEESERRLSCVNLAAALPPGFAQPPFVPSPADPGRKMINRIQSHCPFLSADMLCKLHSLYGAENKPQACIDFPFRYVDTPGGVFVGLTFACTAVLQDSGRDVGERESDLAANYPRSFSRRTTETRPRLTHRVQIAWDAYEVLERDLDAIMGQPHQTLSHRLVAQSIYLDLFTRMFEVARLEGGPPAMGRHAPSRSEVDAARATSDIDLALRFSERMRAENMVPVMLQAVKSRPLPSLQRSFIGIMTAFRQTVSEPRSRASASWRLFTTYISHASRLGSIRLEPLSTPIDYSHFRHIAFDLAPGAYPDYLMTRFFRHALFRKDLLLTDNVWLSHRFMLMHFALLRWYATAIAASERSPAISKVHMQEALRIVEKYYVLHSRFDQLFEKFPTLGAMLDRILHNPRYAGAMAGPPV